jgi:hypothetical protein
VLGKVKNARMRTVSVIETQTQTQTMTEMTECTVMNDWMTEGTGMNESRHRPLKLNPKYPL